MKMTVSKLVLTIALMSFSMAGYASEWLIDNQQSQLNFLSTKKVNVAEVHRFTNLSGDLDSQGQFSLRIDLTSVDTNNAVRDGRMKEFFFETNTFSTALLTAKVEMSDLDAIALGTSAHFTIEANLDLHGKVQPLALELVVTRLLGDALSVVSLKPVILNVSDYSLVAGVDKLRELAKLPSIGHSVPVSFYLTLNLKK